MENDRFKEIVECILKEDYCSTSLIQRRFRLSYREAVHIVDELEALEIVGEFRGAKPRKVLVKSKIELNKILEARAKKFDF